jgi:hypothetical protein
VVDPLTDGGRGASRRSFVRSEPRKRWACPARVTYVEVAPGAVRLINVASEDEGASQHDRCGGAAHDEDRQAMDVA